MARLQAVVDHHGRDASFDNPCPWIVQCSHRPPQQGGSTLWDSGPVSGMSAAGALTQGRCMPYLFLSARPTTGAWPVVKSTIVRCFWGHYQRAELTAVCGVGGHSADGHRGPIRITSAGTVHSPRDRAARFTAIFAKDVPSDGLNGAQAALSSNEFGGLGSPRVGTRSVADHPPMCVPAPLGVSHPNV